MDQPSDSKDITSPTITENALQEEASSSSNHNLISQNELNDFTEKWKKELEMSSEKISKIEKGITTFSGFSDEEKETNLDLEARTLYLKGANMERNGKFYEAIQLYRKAIQIVPNIEMKLHIVSEKPKQKPPESEMYGSYMREMPQNFVHDNFEKYDLFTRIKENKNRTSSICSPKSFQITTHISALPIELILHILRWVVSSDLDLRSLEMFGEVCTGFYLCARDSEIWKLACSKVWGLNCNNSLRYYTNWRQMFIDRSRVRYDGLYISRSTYIRNGENSFQDQFYKPWHLIAYYRYFRFFPEGIVLMLTSTDEPSQCLSQFRCRNSKIPVHSGYYHLKDDIVTLIIHKNQPISTHILKRNTKSGTPASIKQNFYMQFQILNYRNIKHSKLRWIHYSIRTTKENENVSVFDLKDNTFGNLLFSRVKSYCLESDNILT